MTQELIILKPLLHKEQLRIAIIYPFNSKITKAVKQAVIASWSQTHKCWHIPYTAIGYEKLLSALETMAVVNVAALKEYQQSKNTKKDVLKLKPAAPSAKS